MSLVLAGRRRVCVLVLFRERTSDGFAAAGRRLSRVGRSLDAGFAAGSGDAEPCDARVVLSARFHRRWGGSVFGLSLLVVALKPTVTPVRAATGHRGATTQKGSETS